MGPLLPVQSMDFVYDGGQSDKEGLRTEIFIRIRCHDQRGRDWCVRGVYCCTGTRREHGLKAWSTSQSLQPVQTGKEHLKEDEK